MTGPGWLTTLATFVTVLHHLLHTSLICLRLLPLLGLLGRPLTSPQQVSRSLAIPSDTSHEQPPPHSHPSVSSPITLNHPTLKSTQQMLVNYSASMALTSPSGVIGCYPTEPSQTHHSSFPLKFSTTSTRPFGTTTRSGLPRRLATTSWISVFPSFSRAVDTTTSLQGSRA